MEPDHIRTQVPLDFVLTSRSLLCTDPRNSERIRHTKQSSVTTDCRDSLWILDSGLCTAHAMPAGAAVSSTCSRGLWHHHHRPV